MRSIRLPALLFITCLALVGCARTDNFDILVRNETATSLTLALTKDGPPYERVWAAPEDLAIESPKADERHGYVVLPPGREADVSIKGKFEGNTRGYVRVYRGELTISQMNAVGPTSSNRIDLPLRAGANMFIVGEANGKLVEKRGSATRPADTSQAIPAKIQ